MTAFCVSVPESTAPVVLLPSVSVTCAAPVTTFPEASRTSTVIGGASVVLAVSPLGGCPVNTSCDAAPAAMSNAWLTPTVSPVAVATSE